MLGRKQSIKVETLADYGNEEMLNESADVEWVNKVSLIYHPRFAPLTRLIPFSSGYGVS